MADLTIGNVKVGTMSVEFEASPPPGVTLEELERKLIQQGYVILEVRPQKGTILIGRSD